MVISDITLLKMKEIISPFLPSKVSSEDGLKIISKGLSHCGYDLTASDEFYCLSHGNVIDPKDMAMDNFTRLELFNSSKGRYVIVPANSFCLARTVEYVCMPDDLVGLMTTKSTYARCGIVSPPTCLEPCWRGHVTLEISNVTQCAARVYADEGIAQVILMTLDQACAIGYSGKYQGQTGVTLAKV